MDSVAEWHSSGSWGSITGEQIKWLPEPSNALLVSIFAFTFAFNDNVNILFSKNQRQGPGDHLLGKDRDGFG